MTTDTAPPLVYVDFDDVLCQTARTFIKMVEREFGRRYAFEAIQSFDLQQSFDLNPDEYDHLMHLVHDASVLRAMPPMPGALDVLADWHTNGVTIAVVTGRPPATEAVCHEWLNLHRVSYDQIIFVDKYARTHTQEATAQVISPHELVSMGFCLAVEDAPTMIRFLIEHTHIPVAVLDRPWNQDLELPNKSLDGKLTRCPNWSAVADLFTSRFQSPHAKPSCHPPETP